MLTEIDVSLPPLIADLPVPLDGQITVRMEAALREVSALDVEHGADLGALGSLLLRTESVASSKIEQIEASADDYARALHGVRANPSAVSMAAATTALASLVESVDGGRRLELAAALDAHRALMRDDEYESSYAGRVRDVQNWIGGSDHSPRNALYIPPPPGTVDGYLADLTRFANRDDLPVLAQAAIAHAQFESIHPFTDGNGRIGRAVINTVLRRRGATTRVIVPLASALVAHRDRYFEVLGDYRRGRLGPLLRAFTDATAISAEESRTTATRLTLLPAEWREAMGSVRAKSTAARLLEILASNPVITADDVSMLLGSPASSVYAAIDRLQGTGVLRPLTVRRRNQIWGVAAILDELDDLGQRIAQRA